MMKTKLMIMCAVMPVLALAGVAKAITIDTVPVGNPGNTGEWSGESYGGGGQIGSAVR